MKQRELSTTTNYGNGFGQPFCLQHELCDDKFFVEYNSKATIPSNLSYSTKNKNQRARIWKIKITYVN